MKVKGDAFSPTKKGGKALWWNEAGGGGHFTTQAQGQSSGSEFKAVTCSGIELSLRVKSAVSFWPTHLTNQGKKEEEDKSGLFFTAWKSPERLQSHAQHFVEHSEYNIP